MVVGMAMMSFLVHDTLKGVKHIVDGIAKGKDTAMPFHSIGIRIISSFMQVAGLLNNFRLDLPDAVTALFTAQSVSQDRCVFCVFVVVLCCNCYFFAHKFFIF